MESELNKNMNFFNYTTVDQCFVVRTAGTHEKPLFCARDVCLILGLENNRQATARLKPEELHVIPSDSKAGKREMTFISESALYRLIFTSKKQEAEAFQEWVFSDVLPALRKTGAYSMNSRREELEIVEIGARILTSIGTLDDRAKALISSSTLNVISNNSKITAEEEDQNEEWSISRRVQHLLKKNLGTKQDKALLMRAGKYLSQVYQERHGKMPPKRNQFVDGTLRAVNHYTLSDFSEFGDQILRDLWGRIEA